MTTITDLSVAGVVYTLTDADDADFLITFHKGTTDVRRGNNIMSSENHGIFPLQPFPYFVYCRFLLPSELFVYLLLLLLFSFIYRSLWFITERCMEGKSKLKHIATQQRWWTKLSDHRGTNESCVFHDFSATKLGGKSCKSNPLCLSVQSFQFLAAAVNHFFDKKTFSLAQQTTTCLQRHGMVWFWQWWKGLLPTPHPPWTTMPRALYCIVRTGFVSVSSCDTETPNIIDIGKVGFTY